MTHDRWMMDSSVNSQHLWQTSSLCQQSCCYAELSISSPAVVMTVLIMPTHARVGLGL